MLGDWKLPNTDEQDYNVFLGARNGFFTQVLRFRRIDGQWKVATRVERQTLDEGDHQVLYEKVDTGFPLDEHGKVDWGG
jgi:hypothetical protein